MPLTRRLFLSTLGTASLATLHPSSVIANDQIIFSTLTSKQRLRAYIRLLGSLKPTTTYTWFSGELWSILPNTTPQPLVSFQGLAKNIWEVKDEETYVQHNFDTGFFGDLQTGKKLTSFVNPINGKTVQPYPFLYGGGTTEYSLDEIKSANETKPLHPKWIQSGDKVWLDEIQSGSFDNLFDPEIWPNESAGKKLHYGSTTSYIADIEDVFSSESNYASYNLSWSAITPWEPWLLMGDTPGFMQWRATGRKLSNPDEAPDSILNHAKEVQPNFLDEDKRPWEGNKSTWRSFMAERNPTE